jgi:peptidoglycan/LPS O-acetylase OafA/YrhL
MISTQISAACWESAGIIVSGSPTSHAERLAYLDGMRGLAILLVLFYHAYFRWIDRVPFGDAYTGIVLFEYGWLGVNLFFMISGFVILLTIEKCRNFGDFMMRRWLRLFPAMLVCSAIIYLSAPIFFERPMGEAQLKDLTPGLLFLDPDILGRFTGSDQRMLEGTFWSLFAEAKFYVIFGLLYFAVGGRMALWCLIAFFAVATGIKVLDDMVENQTVARALTLVRYLGFNHFGWFAAGACAYQYSKSRDRRYLLASVIVGVCASAATGLVDWHGDVEVFLYAASTVVLFLSAVLFHAVRAVISWRPLLFLGFVSYPLYLVHEGILVSSIVKVGAVAPWMPGLLMPVMPALLIMLLAWVISAHVEPRLRTWFSQGFGFVGIAPARGLPPQGLKRRPSKQP